VLCRAFTAPPPPVKGTDKEQPYRYLIPQSVAEAALPQVKAALSIVNGSSREVKTARKREWFNLLSKVPNDTQHHACQGELLVMVRSKKPYGALRGL
jgi:hypothetical protein